MTKTVNTPKVDAKAATKTVVKVEKKVTKKAAAPEAKKTANAVTKKVVSTGPAVEISDEKLTKAATALLAYLKKVSDEKQDLIDANEETLTLQYSLLNMPANKTKTKFLRAQQIQLPNPLFGGKTQKTCCLFVRDAPKDKPDFWKNWAKENQIPGLTKIMPVKKLKGKYRYFDAKRELAQRFDIFLVDQVVANMMPNVLGSTFLQKKHKIPNPVDIGKKVQSEKFSKNVSKAMESVLCRTPSSASGAVKVGRANMTTEQIVENLKCVSKHIISAFNDKYGIRSLNLTATACPGLNLWELPKSATQVVEYRTRAEDSSDDEESDEKKAEDVKTEAASSDDESKKAPLPLLRNKGKAVKTATKENVKTVKKENKA